MSSPNPSTASRRKTFADRLCIGLMWVSVGFSFAISWSMEAFESAIEWEITDGTDPSLMIPYDYFTYGYWAILIGYFFAFYGIHGNKRYGVAMLGVTILISVTYDTAMGIYLSHYVTRALTQIDYILLGAIFAVALYRLDAASVVSDVETAGQRPPT